MPYLSKHFFAVYIVIIILSASLLGGNHAHAQVTVVNEDFEDGQYWGTPTNMQVPPEIMEENGNKFLRITGSKEDRDGLSYCSDRCPDRNRSTVTFTSPRYDMPLITSTNNRWTYSADMRFVQLNPKAIEVNPIEFHIPPDDPQVCLARFELYGVNNDVRRVSDHIWFDRRGNEDGKKWSTQYDLDTVNYYQWHNYKIVAVFSQDPSVGRYDVYVDGQLKKTVTGATHTGNCRYGLPLVKFGLYGDFSTGILDIDNIHFNPTGSFPTPLPVAPLAHAECVQLQTYPPQTVCSSDNADTEGGTVGNSSGVSNAANSLVAFWKFDEIDGNALDSSGNGNIGVLENGATRYAGTRQGNKLLLDGIDDRMSVPTVSANTSSLNAITIIAWVRPTANGGIIMRKGNTQTARFNFGINAQGQLYFRAGYATPGSWHTTASLPLNAWSYVAVTYTFGIANSPIFYIGGQSAAGTQTQTPAGDAVADTPYLYVGNNADLVNRAVDGFTSGFSGRMDLVRLYGAALSSVDIAALKSPEPEMPDTYNPFPSTETSDGTLVQPMSANPDIAALQTKIQALLAQIASLQSGAPASGMSACPTFARAFGKGSRGADVTLLQRFLIKENLLASDSATGYFGALTERALQRWQAQKGLVLSGSAATTGWGFLGPRTRAAIIAACK